MEFLRDHSGLPTGEEICVKFTPESKNERPRSVAWGGKGMVGIFYSPSEFVILKTRGA